MNKYNFEKAKELIINTPDVKSASLGMHEDWFWTAEDVYENGKFTKELNNDTVIGGIRGSNWATPTLRLMFSDGKEKMIDVSEGESSATKPEWLELGCLSGPCQDAIEPITPTD